MQSASSKRGARIAMYAIPGVMAFGLAVSNYLQQSFGVYLKYQALVDSYYIHSKKQQNQEVTMSIIKDNQQAILDSIHKATG